MKKNWTVKSTVVYRDGRPNDDAQDEWPSLTHEEADARADEFVSGQMRRRVVHGVSLVATAHGQGYHLIQRMEWK